MCEIFKHMITDASNISCESTSVNAQDLIDCKTMLIQEMCCVVKQQVIVWTNVGQAKWNGVIMLIG